MFAKLQVAKYKSLQHKINFMNFSSFHNILDHKLMQKKICRDMVEMPNIGMLLYHINEIRGGPEGVT